MRQHSQDERDQDLTRVSVFGVFRGDQTFGYSGGGSTNTGRRPIPVTSVRG